LQLLATDDEPSSTLSRLRGAGPIDERQRGSVWMKEAPFAVPWRLATFRLALEKRTRWVPQSVP
jgi:hypothetical protein